MSESSPLPLIIPMDKSLVRSTNEVTFSLLLGPQYENGIFRNYVFHKNVIIECFTFFFVLFNDTIFILVHLPKKKMKSYL